MLSHSPRCALFILDFGEIREHLLVECRASFYVGVNAVGAQHLGIPACVLERSYRKIKVDVSVARCSYLYMLSTRDPPQNKGHIQTESEGLEKDIPCK